MLMHKALKKSDDGTSEDKYTNKDSTMETLKTIIFRALGVRISRTPIKRYSTEVKG